MIRLYLVRHGQTVENLEHILQGHMPGHLTNAGKEQMRQLGKELAGIHFDHLLCSDLQRAIDSAICMNLSLPVTTTPLLRERDWGIFTGCKIETIRRDEAFPESVESTEQLYCRATLLSNFTEELRRKKYLVRKPRTIQPLYFLRCQRKAIL